MAPPDHYRLLKPADTVATLRSLPRRARAALFGDPALDVEALAGRAGAGGYSVIGLLTTAAANLDALSRALERAAVIDAEPVPPRRSAGAGEGDLGDAIDAFERSATVAADRLAAISTPGWARPGLLARAQDIAREGAESLRSLERLIGELHPAGDARHA